MDSEAEDPKPSTSKEAASNSDNELNVDKELNKLLTVEEFLVKSKTYMLDHEKHMFLDTIDADCLVVSVRFVEFSPICRFKPLKDNLNDIFRGIGYERVVLNLLKVYCDPANLIIVINSADYEEKYYRSQLDAKYLHESSTNSNERF